ncbi:MAG: hypothetical protein QW692_01835 [Nitrososphaerota archaeon]
MADPGRSRERESAAPESAEPSLAEAIKTLKELESDARQVKWLLALTLTTLIAAIIAKLIIR